jgi:hypothetical protein
MIITITTAPGEDLTYEQRQEILAAVRALGHPVDFLDHWGSGGPKAEDYYIGKLKKLGAGVVEQYRKAVKGGTRPARQGDSL